MRRNGFKLTQEPRVLGEVGKRQCPAPKLDTSEGFPRGSGLLVGEAKGRPGQGLLTKTGQEKGTISAPLGLGSQNWSPSHTQKSR